MRQALRWVRAQADAGQLAQLAAAYLAAPDARAIAGLLEAGHQGAAAARFCARFSERCFPLGSACDERAGGDLLREVTLGIQHAGYGDDWEQYTDVWSLRPVFQLSWALMTDPYGWLVDETLEDDDAGEASAERPSDQARLAVAHWAEVPAATLFAGVPPDGFSADHLRERFDGTCWEPLLWAAPWLWRLSGNPFLDLDEEGEPVAWSPAAVFALTADYRLAERVMRAIDSLDQWLVASPAPRVRAAVRAALGPRSGRLATLLDLPVVEPPRWPIA